MGLICSRPGLLFNWSCIVKVNPEFVSEEHDREYKKGDERDRLKSGMALVRYLFSINPKDEHDIGYSREAQQSYHINFRVT